MTITDFESKRFFYKAVCECVYDGDTVTVRTDVGMFIGDTCVVRLKGIDAPELHNNAHGQASPDGLVSRDALRGLILDKDIYIQTFKDSKEKYGRYLAEIHVADPDKKDGTLIFVNQWMVDRGYAKPYMG